MSDVVWFITFHPANHLVYDNFSGSAFILLIENLVRVRFLVNFPQPAKLLVTAIVILRIASCLLSPAVKETFVAIVENRLEDPLIRLDQQRLGLACQSLQHLSDYVNFDSTKIKKIPEHIQQFEEAFNQPKIGIRYCQLLQTASGETVVTLGNRILQQLKDFMATDPQQRDQNFDTTDLVKLQNLLA